MCHPASTINSVSKKPRIQGLIHSWTPCCSPNRSVDDAVMTWQKHGSPLQPPEPGLLRILFVDLSSAFHTIIPALLQDKFSQLSVPDSSCRWISDFLCNRRQHVKLGKHDSWTISTGSPLRLRPVPYFPYFSPCTWTAAPPVISLSSSWFLQMTPPWLDSSLPGMSLPTSGRLTIWWPGAVRTNWNSACSPRHYQNFTH